MFLIHLFHEGGHLRGAQYISPQKLINLEIRKRNLENKRKSRKVE